MNPFVAANASRYSQARPRYQGQVLETAARALGIDRPVEWAVDVGCGTGHSSMPLGLLANHVVALDSAMAMFEGSAPRGIEGPRRPAVLARRPAARC